MLALVSNNAVIVLIAATLSYRSATISYLVSFIIWVNHHCCLGLLHDSSQGLIVLKRSLFSSIQSGNCTIVFNWRHSGFEELNSVFMQTFPFVWSSQFVIAAGHVIENHRLRDWNMRWIVTDFSLSSILPPCSFVMKIFLYVSHWAIFSLSLIHIWRCRRS